MYKDRKLGNCLLAHNNKYIQICYIDSDNWWYGGMGEAVGGAGAGPH